MHYLSLALCGSFDDGEDQPLPGVVNGVLDLWPVPQLYDARWDKFVSDHSEHNWFEVDVQLAPDVDVKRAAAYLRRVAAWLDKHGAELLEHPRVAEQLGTPLPVDHPRRRPPVRHLLAREHLRAAVEQGKPARPRQPKKQP